MSMYKTSPRGPLGRMTVLSVCGWLLVAAVVAAAVAILFVDSPHPMTSQGGAPIQRLSP